MFLSGPTPMGSMLKDLGLVGTDIFSGVGKVASAITGDPLLLLTVGFLFIGGCVGIFGRLLSRN